MTAQTQERWARPKAVAPTTDDHGSADGGPAHGGSADGGSADGGPADGGSAEDGPTERLAASPSGAGSRAAGTQRWLRVVEPADADRSEAHAGAGRRDADADKDHPGTDADRLATGTGTDAGTGTDVGAGTGTDAGRPEADAVGPLARAGVPGCGARHRRPALLARVALVPADAWRAVRRGGGALRRRALGARAWGMCRASGDAGMATAEYAIVTVAAAAFAGLLIAILRSDEVRGLLLGIVRGALSV